MTDMDSLVGISGISERPTVFRGLMSCQHYQTVCIFFQRKRPKLLLHFCRVYDTPL